MRVSRAVRRFSSWEIKGKVSRGYEGVEKEFANLFRWGWD